MMCPIRRRTAERGQVLILALAFVAFFGLVTVAIFRVADETGVQHAHTEAAASSDASAEGGAAFAAADAGRTDLALSCAAGNTGQLTMQTGDTAKYAINTCNPGQTGGGSGGPGPGLNCLLCILNLKPSPTSPSAQVLNLSCAKCSGAALTTTGGDDYINGSIASPSSLTANPAGAHIRVLSGANVAGCVCSPTPTTYAPASVDPLAGLGAPSPAVTNQPSGCSSWNASNGCTASISQGTATVHSGLWASLSISGGSVTMASGVYVFTGQLSVAGQGALNGNGVTIFLTCAGYGPSGALCPATGSSGGSLSLAGQGGASITAPGSGQYAVANVAILADPNVLDPSGASTCASSGSGCIISAAGKGATTITGTTDTRSSGVSVQGSGGATISGRLIVNSLFMSVSGNVGSGISLGGVSGVSTSSCGVFDVSQPTGTQPTWRAIAQSQCGNGSLSGIVDFNYKQ